MYEYQVTVDNVVDGDTVDLTIDLGLRTYQKGRFRLAGIDAPDNENPAGKTAATNYLKELIPIGTKLRAITNKDKTDKYGRWLVTLWDETTRKNINAQMVESGHAKYKTYKEQSQT